MTGKTFDQTSVDVQATPAEPVKPEAFDFEAYADYEASLLERCRAFWQAESGVLVHRRMRVAEVFSYGCRDMKASLEWQLGGLQKSVEFKADVPNFLVPWYGIGTVAGAVRRLWKPGMKLIVVTYCQSPQEQAETYDRVYEVCGQAGLA